jgi:hypothetical protein
VLGIASVVVIANGPVYAQLDVDDLSAGSVNDSVVAGGCSVESCRTVPASDTSPSVAASTMQATMLGSASVLRNPREVNTSPNSKLEILIIGTVQGPAPATKKPLGFAEGESDRQERRIAKSHQIDMVADHSAPLLEAAVAENVGRMGQGEDGIVQQLMISHSSGPWKTRCRPPA